MYVLKLETYFILMTLTLMQFLASLQEKHGTKSKIMKQDMGVKMISHKMFGQ